VCMCVYVCVCVHEVQLLARKCIRTLKPNESSRLAIAALYYNSLL
jgi:hypothetical protein